MESALPVKAMKQSVALEQQSPVEGQALHSPAQVPVDTREPAEQGLSIVSGWELAPDLCYRRGKRVDTRM